MSGSYAVCACGNDTFVAYQAIDVVGKTVDYRTVYKCEACKRALRLPDQRGARVKAASE